MKGINFHQILVVSRHEIKNQAQSFSYWMIIVWPLVIGFICFRMGDQTTIVSGSSDVLKSSVMVGMLMPMIIFMLCLSYVLILANSVAQDKTNKISEILMVMVDAREQLIGKIVAVYALLIFQLVLYVVFFLSSGMDSSLLADVMPLYWIYIVIDFFVTIFIALIWTTEIASYVTDETQVAMATAPVMLLIGTGTLVATLLNEPNYFGNGVTPIRIFGDVVFVFPPIGSMLMPTLLAQNSVSYFEAFLNLFLELIVTFFIFKGSIKQYRKGLISQKNGNPFLQVLSGEKPSLGKEDKHEY
ncbi:ABC transporter permease [uncultured Secundilactobacillus sp.]|uniref:ABC transporter permease n=1 Tax=uncultured Secundilactobacillus sp. TaxID=2813935 RepID=UPI002588F751|nr:ABC transporter permease [uncultured Secundilactobacillus sp.]